MEPYLYQTVHLLDGRPRLLEVHATVLERAAATLFRRGWRADLPQLAAELAALARRERYPAEVSGFVRLELGATGGLRLKPLGTSLYAGYAVRSVRPDAVTVSYDRLLVEAPTSASEAADALVACAARRAGADAAVRCDSAGSCRAIGDAPLFAIRDGWIVGSLQPLSAAAVAVERGAAAAGIRLADRPLLRSELAACDELFAVDHRGITALAHCDGRPYMAVVVDRLARGMERALGA